MDNKMQILKEEKDVPNDNFMPFSESNLESIYEHVEEQAMEAVSDGGKPVNSLIMIEVVTDQANTLKSQNASYSALFAYFCGNNLEMNSRKELTHLGTGSG